MRLNYTQNQTLSLRSLSKALVLAALSLSISSCENLELPDGTPSDLAEPNSRLDIRAKAAAADSETTINYPVNVYVFKDKKCAELQTLNNEEEKLSIPLVEGTYTVYAIGGAADHYNLPSKEEAAPSAPLTLKEGMSHSDVMIAKTQITLEDGATNVLTLALERKMLLVDDIAIHKIPTAATSVSVTFSPLWETLSLADYDGQDGRETITLTRQEDGRTWTFSDEAYVFPPSDSPATITVGVTTPDGTVNYTYSTQETMTAGTKLSIAGTYTDAVGVTLTGALSGASAWEEKTIAFEFDESGSTSADAPATGDNSNAGGNETDPKADENADDNGKGGNNTGETSQVPAPGSTYMGCYVVSVTEDEGVATVLLLSPKEKKDMGFENQTNVSDVQAQLDAAISACAVSGIEGWRLMTKEEIKTLQGMKNHPVSHDYRYLFQDGDMLRSVKLSSFSPAEKLQKTDTLRPVATLQIQL